MANRHAANATPNSNSSILNQYIDDEEGVYRINIGDQIRYVTMSTDVFEEDTMARPYMLIPRLPTFLEEDWTRMNISRAADDALEVSINADPLPEIQNVWHNERVNVLSLEQIKRHRSKVHEVVYNESQP